MFLLGGCVQTQKEYINEAILKSARTEFLAKGFRNASLRTIAQEANVTLSNIYNYFQDKDAIFVELFKPLLAVIEQAKQHIEEMESSQEHNDESAHLNMLDAPIAYVEKHKEMFKLLLFGAEGSSLSSITNDMSTWFGKLMRRNLLGISQQHNVDVLMPSDFLLQNIGAIWVHFLLDSLKQDMQPEEIQRNAKELMRFVFQGWLGFLGINPH